MNDIIRTVPNPNSEGGLDELYARYRKFVSDLYPELEPDKTFPEFVVWWQGLTPTDREKCEHDFRKGYEQIVKEASQRLNKRPPQRER